MIKNIPLDHRDILSICKICLDKGGIIIYPTDTLYGFGVDARNESAIKRLNHIKGRKSPISIVINDFEQLVSFKSLSKNNKIFVLNNISNKTSLHLENYSY